MPLITAIIGIKKVTKSKVVIIEQHTYEKWTSCEEVLTTGHERLR
jgi:hypothetical protein